MKQTRLFRIRTGIALLGTFVAALMLFGRISFTHAAGIAATTHTYSAKSSSSACGAWSTVPSVNVGTHPNGLNGVSAISASDVWAVGNYVNSSSVNQTLIEHWDGSSWSVIPSPKMKNSFSYLVAVKALSASNAWAVGYSNNQTLIEHWAGTGWSVVPGPNVSMMSNYLQSITAVSANDMWAVGYSSNSSNVAQTLVEHWDGTSWSIVSSPNAGSGGNTLFSVAATSTNDVWAVGGFDATTNSNVSRTLIEHWDGTSWSIVSSPNVGTLGSSLAGVTSISASNVWAVGSYTTSGTPYNYQQTLIEHWNGSTWSVVSSPDVGSYWNQLDAVQVVSTKNIWAVGNYLTAGSHSIGQTLVEHWNGTNWQVVSSPNPGTGGDFLHAIARIPGTIKMWAVGNYAPTIYHVNQTLTEFYC